MDAIQIRPASAEGEADGTGSTSPVPPPRTAACVRTCELCKSAYSGSKRSRFCKACYPNRRRRRCKWEATEQVVAIFRQYYNGEAGCVTTVRARLIAAGQPRWPAHAIRRVALDLGLTRSLRPSRAWTAEEDDVLREWGGRRSPRWMAKRLGRTCQSVIGRLRRLDIGLGVNDGYTLTQLAACFGVAAATARTWIEKRWLVASVQRTEREHDIYRISEEAIKEFMRKHPLAYNLHQVDQLWFLGFTLGDLGDREEREGMPTSHGYGDIGTGKGSRTASGKRKSTLSMRAERGGVSTSGLGLESA